MIYRQLLSKILLLTIVLTLAACGGRGTVVTKDDSAEYQSAQALPPLKKPGYPTNVSVSDSANSSVPEVSVEVVERKKDSLVLQINADADTSWQVLSQLLRKSDLTVHVRNKDAQRVAIGCAGIDEQSDADSTKKRGWVFSRSRRDNNDDAHCSLQMSSKKSSSTVKVLKRDGEEVAPEMAQLLFTRLLG